MLLQRLPSAEPTVEAAIAYNLVDLALVAPPSAFNDIVKAFSAINRSANPDDPRFSNNMVGTVLNQENAQSHYFLGLGCSNSAGSRFASATGVVRDLFDRIVDSLQR